MSNVQHIKDGSPYLPQSSEGAIIEKETFLGGGDGGMTIEARVARLESDVKHISSDISDIKVDVRDLSKKIDSNFKWLISIYLGSFGALAALIAHGFKWF